TRPSARPSTRSSGRRSISTADEPGRTAGFGRGGHAVLTLTGERTLPGIWHENYWFRRHEAAYAWLGPLCRGRVVVDAGCGEGYGGAALLAAGARAVVGLDLDTDAVAHVFDTYPSLAALRANVVALPLTTGSVE